MSIMDQLGGMGAPAQAGNMQNMMNMINGRFGNMQNALGFLNGLMGKRQTTPRDFAMRELRGKKFSQEQIDICKDFIRKNGYTDQQIDSALKELGII